MICYLGLGTNLGDKQQNLQNAIAYIAERIGVLSAISSVCETEPWGFNSDNHFLNQVVCVNTDLSPVELLTETQEIEKEIGRKEKTKTGFEDRIIDIDILFYGDLIIESGNLQIPHPHIHERLFVLIGLYEIAPDFIHPVLKKSISECFTLFRDKGH